MIIATAGHVDHGKTLLVKALTGIDTDRLPEEKQRGMTIDLGFAYLPTESGESIGFVDVPGHERFIRNMLCGVTGVDFVLFIVAADDGPMPQSVEHLAIVDLLGVRAGAVVLTKVDRVAADRLAEARQEIAILTAGSVLADAPIFPVSSPTGAGIAELKAHLIEAARQRHRRAARGNFRLAVDRCFTVAGAGVVVTGTVVSGSIGVGDKVRALLSGVAVRVRAIRAQNAQAGSGRAGQRCALNLAGADLRPNSISRGDWIVGADGPSPVTKLDARIRVLGSEQRPLGHWTSVHLHLGAADVTGRVAVLEGPSIHPGETGLVQLALDRPIGAAHGDGFIVRDQSAQRTIGGGRVIDIFTPPRGRAKPQRLAHIKAMEQEADDRALAALLEAAPEGLNLSRFAANRNLRPDEVAALLRPAGIVTVATEAGQYGFASAQWDRLKASALEVLAAWHRRMPDAVGPSEEMLLAGLKLRLPRATLTAMVAELARHGLIVRAATGLRLSSHRPRLDPADARLWSKIAPLLEENPLRPPLVQDIAAALAEDAHKIDALLARAARHGLVVRLSKNRFFQPCALRQLGDIAEALAQASGNRLVTAGAFRDRAGIGRNLTIEVLEFFDRMKFTRRIGDARQVLRPAGVVFGAGTDGKETHPGGAPGLQIR